MEPALEKNVDATGSEYSAEQTASAEKAAPAVKRQSRAEYRMIAFSLAGRDYGIDIMKIKEISHEGKFTYVPNAAPFVVGVHNLRGEIIPIIDLRRMFSLAVPETRSGSELNILILKLDKLVLGVIVDSIEGVVGTPADSVQPPHPIFGDINMQYISGVVERDGKLIVILDVEKIFLEKAVAPKTAHEQKTQRGPAPSGMKTGGDQELKFICEGLSTFASFFASEMNLPWIERRLDEWKRSRSREGVSVQFRGAEDAREFLRGFASPGRGELWSDVQRSTLLSLLPSSLSGTFVIWNHGCGRGFDAYSMVCALKKAFGGLTVKAWANDANLVEIASAPALTLPKEKTPSFFTEGGFVKETPTGMQFTAAVRESIIFEYTESLLRTEELQADLIVSRDVLSYLPPETQKMVLDAFAQSVKPGGLLILGANERLGAAGWRAVEKGGLRAYEREIPKE